MLGVVVQRGSISYASSCEIKGVAESMIDFNSYQFEDYTEFETLSRRLAEKELELATLENRRFAFEKRYISVVGILLAELDAVEKEIARELFRRHPDEEQPTVLCRLSQSAIGLSHASIAVRDFQPPSLTSAPRSA